MTCQSATRALIVDAGNTKVRLAAWCAADQEPRRLAGDDQGFWPATPVQTLATTPTSQLALGDPVLVEIASRRDADGDLPLIVTSVVPSVVEVLRGQWSDLTLITHQMALPFGLNFAQPETVGSDRLCNVAAAAASGYQRVLVVDAGTATTFDLLIDGEFAGGLIAPGMAFAATCLGAEAAQLAPIPFAPCPLEPGRDTASAMQAGAFHVGVGGVQAVIESLCAKYGPLPVVVTGGLGGLLQGVNRHWDPDWTLRGAAQIGI